MVYILMLLSIPLLYVVLTLFVSVFINRRIDGIHTPISASLFFKEVVLQFLVFFITPMDLIRKWEYYPGKGEKLVVLLPGYTETQFIFLRLRKQLKKEGIGYTTMKYSPFLGPLDSHVQNLKALIEFELLSNPNLKLYLVGHSMGGLICRKYCENNHNNSINLLLMVSTPHEGTILGKVGLGESAVAIKPKSTFIKSLKNRPLEIAVNIYSKCDNLITPSSSLNYFNKNLILNDIYLHNSSMFSDETIELILNKIDK